MNKTLIVGITLLLGLSATPVLAASHVALDCAPSGLGYVGSWTYPTGRPDDNGWFLGYPGPYFDDCADVSGPLPQPDGTVCAFDTSAHAPFGVWPRLRYSRDGVDSWDAAASTYCDGATHCFSASSDGLGGAIEVDCLSAGGLSVDELTAGLQSEVVGFGLDGGQILLLVFSFAFGMLVVRFALSYLRRTLPPALGIPQKKITRKLDLP